VGDVGIIVLAAVAMVISDVLSVILVQAEARNRAVLAGVFDTLGWLAAVIVTLLTLNALNGHNVPLMIGVVGGVSVANFGGTWLGTTVGKRYVREDATKLAERVTALERIVTTP
jgi:hypothetical protein